MKLRIAAGLTILLSFSPLWTPLRGAIADLFFSTEKPLLDYGDGLIKSKVKTNAFSLPLTVLVNRQTTGAAEAFAGILRQAQVGLLLGTNTAGKATIGKEFTLQTGQR